MKKIAIAVTNTRQLVEETNFSQYCVLKASANIDISYVSSPSATQFVTLKTGDTIALKQPSVIPIYIRGTAADYLEIFFNTDGLTTTSISLNASDIEIGAVELKDGATDQRASIDATGALKVTGLVSSVSAQYISPADFTVTYTSASTVTLTGVPFTVVTGAQVVYIKIRNSSTNVTSTYVAGANGYGFGHASGVITAYLNGVVVNIFTANDMYEVGLNGQAKYYEPTIDVAKTVNLSPDRASYVMDSLVDTTNVAAGTTYYPSALGMSMDGFKDMSLTGKIIEGDAVTDTISVEATNDEDQTNADRILVYGFDTKNNAATNIVTTGGVAGTYTFALDYDNLNYAFYRIKLVTADSTNTVIIKMRRKSL